VFKIGRLAVVASFFFEAIRVGSSSPLLNSATDDPRDRPPALLRPPVRRA
jgi:hypothetical protein